MREIVNDVRFGLRQLRRSPALTLAAVVCLALGIGANSAAFSFVDSLLFWQPPVHQPERLVRLFVDWSGGLRFGSFSYPDLVDLRQQSEALDGLVAEHLVAFHVSSGGENRRLAGYEVTPDYFRVLGVRPALGRDLLPAGGDLEAREPVVMLGWSYWQRRFDGDPSVVGRTLLLNGQPVTVVGVTPEGYIGATNLLAPELWVPITLHDQLFPGSPMLERRGSHSIGTVLGRLAPGVTAAAARASLAAQMKHLAEEHPDSNTGAGLALYPEAESSPHPMVRGAFLAFFGLVAAVVAVVLLLAAANVAGLATARAAARSREVGIRLSLGATRGRLVRQLLTESLLLATAGGAAGLGIARLLVHLARSFQPPTELPIHLEVHLGLPVVLFTAAVTLGTGVLFGLAPAFQASRQELVPALKATSGATRRTSWLRRGLVVGQVALCLVLLIVAGMALRSLEHARHMDLGFDPEGVLVASLETGVQGYDETRGRAFFHHLVERMRALPGVEAVGLGEVLPLRLSSQQRDVLPEGFEVPKGENTPTIDFNIVDPGYFGAMAMPLLRGRFFTAADDAGAPPVAIVNQAFARRFWPGEDPVGKRFESDDRDVEVIGVVPTGRYFSLGEDPKPYVYLPLAQSWEGNLVLHVRTEGDPLDLAAPLREVVRSLDPALPVSDLETLRQSLAFAFLPARMAAGLVAAFSLLALLLAAVGLYGVVAYSVARQTREIGVRMALGAGRGRVLAEVVRRGMTLVAVGLALGLAGGLASTWLATGLLYGVSPVDPLAYGAGVSVLAAVALLASFLPARRATGVDPASVLRSE